jgi:hypothetical protein
MAKIQRLGVMALVFASVLIVCTNGFASVVVKTFVLDQSNTFTDGVTYGTVKLTADDSAGTVEFELNAPYVYDGALDADDDFGFKTFAFNAGPGLSYGSKYTLSLPHGWEFKGANGSADGFGKYDVKIGSSGDHILQSFNFTAQLTDKSQATIANFANLHGESPTFFFAAHVKGFDETKGEDGHDEESHWIAGSEEESPKPVPEPTTSVIWLVLGGVAVAFGRPRR